MADVRYVCLSDLHLGSENSVLSALDGDGEVDGHLTAPALAGLVECLGEIVSRNEDRSTRPTLVLGGDILELALSAENRAAMVFERFADLAFPEGGGIFADTVYFVPGNHDHQLWESSREQQYAGYVRDAAAGGVLHPPWPISRMLAFEDPNPVESALLNALVQRRPHRAGMVVRAVYPNMAIPSDDGRRWVVFHHGHFVESLYRVVSTVRDLLFPGRSSPVDVWDIEAENGPWIDAMWTALGRSGEAGAGLGGAGHDALKSDKAMRRLAAGLAAGVAARRRAPGPARMAEARVLRFLLRSVVRRVAGNERRDPTVALSPGAEAALNDYLEGPLRRQIEREAPGGSLPDELAFVFGHTHKPFAGTRRPSGYDRTVDVLNTGGWVVDTREPAPMQGGAAVLLDDDLHAALLRLYNESVDGRPTPVRVEHAGHGGAATNPLFDRLAGMVDADAQPWAGFATTVAEAVDEHRRRLCASLAALERPSENPRRAAWT